MAQTARFDGDQVDYLVKVLKNRKDKLLDGSERIVFGKNVADEVSDIDSILYTLGEDADE